MLLARLGVERRERRLPGLALRQQLGEAIAVDLVLEHLLVDIGRQRHGRPVRRLRHDPGADGAERRPFRSREEARPGMHGEALVDRASRRLVPGQRVALVEDVVAGKARRSSLGSLDQRQRREAAEGQPGEARRRRDRRAVDDVLPPVPPAAHGAGHAVAVEAPRPRSRGRR